MKVLQLCTLLFLHCKYMGHCSPSLLVDIPRSSLWHAFCKISVHVAPIVSTPTSTVWVCFFFPLLALLMYQTCGHTVVRFINLLAGAFTPERWCTYLYICISSIKLNSSQCSITQFCNTCIHLFREGSLGTAITPAGLCNICVTPQKGTAEGL